MIGLKRNLPRFWCYGLNYFRWRGTIFSNWSTDWFNFVGEITFLFVAFLAHASSWTIEVPFISIWPNHKLKDRVWPKYDQLFDKNYHLFREFTEIFHNCSTFPIDSQFKSTSWKFVFGNIQNGLIKISSFSHYNFISNSKPLASIAQINSVWNKGVLWNHLTRVQKSLCGNLVI